MNSKDNNKLFVIIDGSALICSSYYGSLPESLKYTASKNLSEEELNTLYDNSLPKNDKGEFVNGIDIFMSILFDIEYRLQPEKIAICFDEGRDGTFRRAIYPEYKAQRGPTPIPLKQQIKNIQTLVKETGYPCFSSREFEADDYAGSIAKFGEENGYQVRLLTKDRDYFQLATENTKIWWMVSGAQQERLSLICNTKNIPTGCVEFGIPEIEAEIGLHPTQIADWKGISGDASDNLPGVKGVSDKVAVPLLMHYGSLENIIADLTASDDHLKAKWKTLGITRPPVTLMKQQQAEALFYRDLAIIKTDVEIPEIDDYYESFVTKQDFIDIAKNNNLTALSSNIANADKMQDFDYER